MSVVKERMEPERTEALAQGRYIKELRLDAGFNRPETMRLLKERGVDMSPDYLRKIEEGHRPLRGLSLDIREALRALYRVSPETWEEKTGLHVPLDPPEAATKAFDAFEPTVRVPLLGSVSAGLRDNSDDDEGAVLFDRNELPKGVANPKNLRLLFVNGDSMYAEGLPHPIPWGSRVLLELGAAPRESEVVVAWIDELELRVLKQFSRHGALSYLRSYKPGGPSFWEDRHRMTILGVVRRYVIDL